MNLTKTIASPMRIYALQGYKLSESNRKIMSKFFVKFIDDAGLSDFVKNKIAHDLDDEKYIDENSNNKEFKNYSIFDAYIRPLGLR